MNGNYEMHPFPSLGSEDIPENFDPFTAGEQIEVEAGSLSENATGAGKENLIGKDDLTNTTEDFGEEIQPSISPFTSATDQETLLRIQEKPQQAADESAMTEPEDPLAAALKNAVEKEQGILLTALAAKPPMFSYSDAEDPILDKKATFEMLREEHMERFPELEDANKVTWNMVYGNKRQTCVKTQKVWAVKESIEKSTAFQSWLKTRKTDKERDVICKVKPEVRAEKKGHMPAYMGIFPTLTEAVAGEKLISIVPSRNGKVFEIRNTALGRFCTPTKGYRELSDIIPGFAPSLPLVPQELLMKIVGFFRYYMTCFSQESEVSAHIVWNKERRLFEAEPFPKNWTANALKNGMNHRFTRIYTAAEEWRASAYSLGDLQPMAECGLKTL